MPSIEVILPAKGDMKKSVYDTNDDGKVNSADTADSATTATEVGGVIGGDTYYGTQSGIKNFYTFPTIGSGDMEKSTYDTNDDGTVNSADSAVEVAGSPTATQYYGTNASSTKGFYDFPSFGTGDVNSETLHPSAFKPGNSVAVNLSGLTREELGTNVLVKNIKIHNKSGGARDVRIVGTLGAITYPHEAFNLPDNGTVDVRPDYPLNFSGTDKIEAEIPSGNVDIIMNYLDSDSSLTAHKLELGTSENIFYTCPASTSTFIGYIKFLNMDATTQTITLTLEYGGTDYILEVMTLTQGESYEVPLGGGITMSAGDDLKMIGTVGNYIVVYSGKETTI